MSIVGTTESPRLPTKRIAERHDERLGQGGPQRDERRVHPLRSHGIASAYRPIPASSIANIRKGRRDPVGARPQDRRPERHPAHERHEHGRDGERGHAEHRREHAAPDDLVDERRAAADDEQRGEGERASRSALIRGPSRERPVEPGHLA
jgi:hypothetical protein